ncbi:hypothetical protein P171DRAFT_438938 [Karstenula rhodostoma CBS 690.94]|uniref:Uncharacterized protein n=1 Tax=Karstenula rhodostoma CBS 690.94 TaxID=1392251 RepID=A0A9P4UHI1_9PLEO|nr:hypothetical protein P171DRAFT_438938 [Karstenula rhodostoma CBS 690.94]
MPRQTNQRDHEGPTRDEINRMRAVQEQMMRHLEQYPRDEVRHGNTVPSRRRNDTEAEHAGSYTTLARSRGHAHSHAGPSRRTEVPVHHTGSQNVGYAYEPSDVDDLVQRTGSLNIAYTGSPTHAVLDTTMEIQDLVLANEDLRRQLNGWNAKDWLQKLVRENERLRRELSQQQNESDGDNTEAQ